MRLTPSKKFITALLPLLLALALCGCGTGDIGDAVRSVKKSSSLPEPVTGASVEDMSLRYTAEASGVAVQSCGKASIDYSNISDGYVMVWGSAEMGDYVKIQVHGSGDTYSYTLPTGEWAVLPLSEGSGEYRVNIFENVGGSRYAMILSADFYASVTDELSPFLRPNVYVNYAVAPNTVATAAMLTEGMDSTLSKVAAVYDYVTGLLEYDRQLAATVQAGYIPDLDGDLVKRSGICFDYAALMAGMLRSVGVPSKMVFGYAGDLYHAWLNVWSEESGWINKVVCFNGSDWQRFDPTYASYNSEKSSAEYVGNGDNYVEKFFY